MDASNNTLLEIKVYAIGLLTFFKLNYAVGTPLRCCDDYGLQLDLFRDYITKTYKRLWLRITRVKKVF